MTYTLEELENMKDEGGSLYLSGCTSLTSLPDNLTVGGWLDLSGSGVSGKERDKVRKLTPGVYVPGRYIYCDGILTHIKRVRKFGKYTYYIGKIPSKNVISDGTIYAHCDSFRSGVSDLEFKSAAERGADQYKEYTLDTVLKPEDAKTMYRIITGACRQRTQSFVDSLGKLKKSYTVAEIIELTAGHYGSERFKSFFEEKGEDE